ncbi:hypothetical protein SAMN05660657_00747 [Geodermatophilus amargosae]|uniref:Uncharacterized protein n=1 Tax=Geodermatophilus amargosae TaxID=1296565 RepID=A0A1I6XY08_9ACTN|nr:hypothetical protein [Geodermatophilus amargosae]SFT43249.1 hypothetical protein SAMN05660657_00747 [Geodermatophilus amargosae]
MHEYPGWALVQRLAPVLPAYVVLAVVTVAVLAVTWGIHVLVERPLGPRLRRVVERDLTRLLAERVPARRSAPATPTTEPFALPAGEPSVARHASAAGHGAVRGARVPTA